MIERRSITGLPPKAHFQAYEEVRRSGLFNMLTDVRQAAEHAGLTTDDYQAVRDDERVMAVIAQDWPGPKTIEEAQMKLPRLRRSARAIARVRMKEIP